MPSANCDANSGVLTKYAVIATSLDANSGILSKNTITGSCNIAIQTVITYNSVCANRTGALANRSSIDSASNG